MIHTLVLKHYLDSCTSRHDMISSSKSLPFLVQDLHLSVVLIIRRRVERKKNFEKIYRYGNSKILTVRMCVFI